MLSPEKDETTLFEASTTEDGILRWTKVFPKQYRFDAGKVTRVTNFMGTIRFNCHDENGHFDECIFFLSSYRVKRVRTLCQIFTVGDWVAFIALKLDRGHWTALDVRHRSETINSYGQFKKPQLTDAVDPNEAIIRPQNRALLGGGDVVVWKRALPRSSRGSFGQLQDGEWLRFVAMEKPDYLPKSSCTAAAVEAEVPLILGLIVQRTNEVIQIWCPEVGLATGRVPTDSRFAIGQWARFQLGAQNATDGQWIAFHISHAPSPGDVLVKVGKYIRVTALATAGVLVPRFGTVWSEKLGRMSVWRWCLKNVDIQQHQRVVVRAFYHINDDRRWDTNGDAWTVYELKAAPNMPKVSAFALSPSIIYNVQAVIEEICLSPRKWYSTSSLPPCYWRLRSEKYGSIVARPVDVLPSVTEEGLLLWPHLRPGDWVKVSLHPVSLSNLDEYRAFVLEKRHPVEEDPINWEPASQLVRADTFPLG